MTRETYLYAKRRAALHYMEVARHDMETAKTPRQRNNARRRYDAGKRTFDAIQNGTFWNAMTEYTYKTLGVSLPEDALGAISAI